MQFCSRLLKGLIGMSSIILVVFIAVTFIKLLYDPKMPKIFLYLSFFLWPYSLAIIKEQEEVFSSDNMVAAVVSIAIIAGLDSVIQDSSFAEIMGMILFSGLPFYKLTLTSDKKKAKIEG